MSNLKTNVQLVNVETEKLTCTGTLEEAMFSLIECYRDGKVCELRCLKTDALLGRVNLRKKIIELEIKVKQNSFYYTYRKRS